MTDLASLIHEVHERFTQANLVYGHGTDNAWDEAVALVLAETGMKDDVAELQRRVPAAAVDGVRRLTERRVRERLPLPYLLGRCRLAGVECLIEPGVIVPRSPIAFLLRDGLRPWLAAPPARVLDLCAGSGCLGILAALAFDGCTVQLAELDAQAAALARRNVDLHGLGDRVTVVQGDLFEPVDGPFDLIVSNPPYVDAADMSSRPPEYRAEPELALAAGVDGLSVARRILAQAREHLVAHGLLVCEVGASAPALMRQYPRLPFIWPELSAGGEGVFLLEAAALHSHTAPLQ